MLARVEKVVHVVRRFGTPIRVNAGAREMGIERQVRAGSDGTESENARGVNMLADAKFIVVAALDYQRGDAMPCQLDGRGQSRRSATDDENRICST
jgi:hypothetical protein